MAMQRAVVGPGGMRMASGGMASGGMARTISGGNGIMVQRGGMASGGRTIAMAGGRGGSAGGAMMVRMHSLLTVFDTICMITMTV